MQDPWKKLFRNVKLSAQRHGSVQLNADVPCEPREFNITVEDLQQQFSAQNGRCWWFNIKLIPEDIFRPFYPLAMSVDRLDNAIGYTRDNIIITCRFANLGRGKADRKTMEDIVSTLQHTKYS